MRTLLVAFTLLFSVSTFAKSVTVEHDYTQVLGAIKLSNACVTDDEVRSIDPVNVCTQLVARTTGAGGEAGTQTDWICVNWELKDLAYARAFERTVCLKHAPINEGSSGECLKFGKKADFLPKTIPTRVIVNHGEVSTETRSSFTFPACH